MADDDLTSVLVSFTAPVDLSQRWAELRKRARVQGGATTEAAEVEMIIRWAQAEAARRSRD